MYRFLLRPKWIGFHLLCVVGIVGMVSAGVWQLHRNDQRHRFEQEVRDRTDADVVPLADVLAIGTPAEMEWRRVEATGTYVQDRQFEVVNVGQGGVSGHDAVDALRLDDGSLLIVNRGFVAGAAPLPPAPTDEVTIVGRVRTTQTAGTGQTSDDGSQRLTQIRRVDLGALAQQFDESVLPVYVDLLDATPPDDASLQPVAFPSLGGGPPHMSYAIQWFTFSVCVVVGWVLAVRRSALAATGRAKPKRRKVPPIADEYR
jgi:cytochrome oxidase assembly protein ShyY1